MCCSSRRATGRSPYSALKALQNAAIGLPRRIREAREGGRLVIERDKVSDASGLDLALARLNFLARHGRFISRHELRRPGQTRKRHTLVARPPQIPARPAPAVDIAVHVFRRFSHQRSTSSHGLHSSSGSTVPFVGMAASASSFIRSQSLASVSASNRTTFLRRR